MPTRNLGSSLNILGGVASSSNLSSNPSQSSTSSISMDRPLSSYLSSYAQTAQPSVMATSLPSGDAAFVTPITNTFDQMIADVEAQSAPEDVATVEAEQIEANYINETIHNAGENAINDLYVNGYPNEVTADVAETKIIDFGHEHGERSEAIKKLLEQRYNVAKALQIKALSDAMRNFNGNVDRHCQEITRRWEAMKTVRERLVQESANLQQEIDVLIEKNHDLKEKRSELLAETSKLYGINQSLKNEVEEKSAMVQIETGPQPQVSSDEILHQ